MTRRDILKGLAVLAPGARAFAGAPQKAIGILVRIQERRSDLCLLRGDLEISHRSIPIGRGHFVNDVACCLGIDRKCAAELVGKYGLPPVQDGVAAPTARHRRGVIRNASGSVVSVPRDLYTDIVEARAAEFARLVRDGVRTARAGKASTTPILLIGVWITGLDRLIERGALWNTGCPPAAA